MRLEVRELLEADCYRCSGNKKLFSEYRKNKVFRQIFYLRLYQNADNRLFRWIYRFMFKAVSRKTTVEIGRELTFGKGLLFLHPGSVTIHGRVVFGENVTIMKGATIGKITLGQRSGVPTIGNRVYIRANSTVAGGIHVGDDVVIAPNTLVNFDVPDHSVVIGVPGVIHHKENATEGYVVRCL